MLNITKYKVTIRLIEDMLGTVPKNKKVFSSFILDRQRKEVKRQADLKGVPHANGQPVTEESIATLMDVEPETIQETEERGWTAFHADPMHGPFIFDYAIKGFLKESARTLKEWGGDGAEAEDEAEEGEEEKPSKKGKKKDGTIKQLQDKFSRYVYVVPRKVYFYTKQELVDVKRDTSGNLAFDNVERPLRAMTAQGPRITVVRSDLIPADRELTFHVHVLKGAGISKALLMDVLSYGQYQGLGQWRSGGYGRFDVVSVESY